MTHRPLLVMVPALIALGLTVGFLAIGNRPGGPHSANTATGHDHAAMQTPQPTSTATTYPPAGHVSDHNMQGMGAGEMSAHARPTTGATPTSGQTHDAGGHGEDAAGGHGGEPYRQDAGGPVSPTTRATTLTTFGAINLAVLAAAAIMRRRSRRAPRTA